MSKFLLLLGVASVATGLFGAGTSGGTLLGSEPDGMAIDFTAATPDMLIRDSGATKNYSGDPFSKLTFNRASTAYYYNSSGVLTQAASGAGRIDFNPATLAARGLLVEEARTNLMTRSQEVDHADWTKNGTTVSADAVAAPDGTTTADQVVETATTTDHHVRQQKTVTNNATITISVYAKASTRTFLWMSPFDGASHVTWFNLTNGTVGTNAAGNTASIQSVGNGWYRCVVTRTISGTTPYLIAGPADADNSQTYLGDITKNVYLWGAQFEEATFATSYIPTTSASVTRAAETPNIAKTLFPFSATVGTLVAEFEVTSVSIGERIAAALVTTDYQNSIFVETNLANPNAIVFSGGVGQASIDAGTVLEATAGKLGIAWATDDIAGCFNGGTVGTDATATIPTVTDLDLGYLGSSAGHLNGWLRKLTYIPLRKSNANLQTLTT